MSFQADLSPSRRALRLRRVAIALTTVAAAACLLAAAVAPTILRVFAGAVALAVLAVAVLRRPRTAATGLAVDADGTLRVEDGGEFQRAAVGYCSPQLVCLRTAHALVPIWPDALPQANWRRLLVACRWPHAPEQAQASGVAN